MTSVESVIELTVRARLLQLIAALERAGGTPVGSHDLQAFAYLANVLSPIWDIEPLEGSVLKDSEGPRSWALQQELDVAIGSGLIIVEALKSISGTDGKLRLDPSVRLAADRARPILEAINRLPDEEIVSKFLTELAFTFVEIRPDRRDDAALVDAAWSNPSISEGRVVDFAEFVEATRGNPAWNAAQNFQRFAPVGVTLNRAEKLVMYMRLLKRRAHG